MTSQVIWILESIFKLEAEVGRSSHESCQLTSRPRHRYLLTTQRNPDCGLDLAS